MPRPNLSSRAEHTDVEVGLEDSPAPAWDKPVVQEDSELYDQIVSINGHNVKNVAVLSFRALQLHRIAKLQEELAREQLSVLDAAKRMRTPEKAGAGHDIDDLIQRYANAIRNYETLTRITVHDKKAEYEFLGKKGFKVVKREHTTKWLVKPPQEVTVGPTDYGPMGFRELDQRRGEERELLSRFYSRFFMALFGGLSLLVPMLIMSLSRGLLTALVTTSVSTAVFSAIITVFSTDSTGKDVVASTAAYTAVLMVFVGTTLQNIAT